MNLERYLAGLLCLPLCGTPLRAQQKAPPSPAVPEVIRVGGAQPAAPATQASATSVAAMDAAQVKALMDQVRFSGYRINDLLTDVRPERWKMPKAARASFNQTLGTLRGQMGSLNGWREEFQKRPDSMYLGYEVYAAINAVLPRLEGVARTVSSADNPSYGAQFDEGVVRLFDLQQTLGGYLGNLLRNQDQILSALQNNLAGCQNELGQAMRGRATRARGIRNAPPIRPYRRPSRTQRPTAKGAPKTGGRTSSSSATPPKP